eukprot:3478272-Rhodomonas_salina.1
MSPSGPRRRPRGPRPTTAEIATWGGPPPTSSGGSSNANYTRNTRRTSCCSAMIRSCMRCPESSRAHP